MSIFKQKYVVSYYPIFKNQKKSKTFKNYDKAKKYYDYLNDYAYNIRNIEIVQVNYDRTAEMIIPLDKCRD